MINLTTQETPSGPIFECTFEGKQSLFKLHILLQHSFALLNDIAWNASVRVVDLTKLAQQHSQTALREYKIAKQVYDNKSWIGRLLSSKPQLATSQTSSDLVQAKEFEFAAIQAKKYFGTMLSKFREPSDNSITITTKNSPPMEYVLTQRNILQYPTTQHEMLLWIKQINSNQGQ